MLPANVLEIIFSGAQIPLTRAGITAAKDA